MVPPVPAKRVRLDEPSGRAASPRNHSCLWSEAAKRWGGLLHGRCKLIHSFCFLLNTCPSFKSWGWRLPWSLKMPRGFVSVASCGYHGQSISNRGKGVSTFILHPATEGSFGRCGCLPYSALSTYLLKEDTGMCLSIFCLFLTVIEKS